MKTCYKSFLTLLLVLMNVTIALAAIPEVHVRNKFPAGDGKYTKIAYSDIFTTNLNGENVKMRLAYVALDKNNPAVMIEILTKDSKIYKEISSYVTTLASVGDKFKYTGKRICDIKIFQNGTWMLATKFAVAGSSLQLVRLTYDDIDPGNAECVAVTFPLSMMDSSKFNWDGKNRWKETLKELTSGSFSSIVYSFENPTTRKMVSFTLPVNSDMALLIQKLEKAYYGK